MRRRLFAVVSAVSPLLLFAAVVTLCVRGTQTTVVLAHYRWKQARWQAVLSRGHVAVNNHPQLDWEQKQTKAINAQRFFVETKLTIALERLQSHYGYSGVCAGEPDVETQALIDDVATARRNYNHVMSLYRAQTATPSERHDLPLSLLAGLAAALPSAWLLRVRGRKAIRGVCSICSYNLTGNTSGVCPECGTPVPHMVGNAA